MLSKIEAGLQMPVIRHDKRSATRSPEKEERMVRRLSPGNYERSKKEQERESKKTSGQLGSSVTNAAKESNIETKTIKKKVSSVKPCKIFFIHYRIAELSCYLIYLCNWHLFRIIPAPKIFLIVTSNILTHAMEEKSRKRNEKNLRSKKFPRPTLRIQNLEKMEM